MDSFIDDDDQNVIFIQTNGYPIKFYADGGIFKKQMRIIEKYGGELVSSPSGPNTIYIVKNGAFISYTTYECFNSQWVYDCINANRLLNIENYRANKRRYISKFPVMQIVLGISTWEDAKKEDDELGTEVNDDGLSDNEDYKASSVKRNLKIRLEYTHKDRVAILNYIINNKRHNDISGNVLWKEMESKNVCEGHTWESIKNHFHRKIKFALTTYNLDEKDIARLENRTIKADKYKLSGVCKNKHCLKPSCEREINADSTTCVSSDLNLTKNSASSAVALLPGIANVICCDAPTTVKKINAPLSPVIPLDVNFKNVAETYLNEDKSVYEELVLSNEFCESGIIGSNRSYQLKEKNLCENITTNIFSKQIQPNLEVEKDIHLNLSDESTTSDANIYNNDLNPEATEMLPDSTVQAIDKEELVTKDSDSYIKEHSEREPIDKKSNESFVLCSDIEISSENDEKNYFLPKKLVFFSSSDSDEFNTSDAMLPSSDSENENNKLHCKFYSRKDDEKLLEYFIDNGAFSNYKGNQFWQVMESEKIVEKRTWQSLKERFLSRILPSIKNYNLDPLLEEKFLGLSGPSTNPEKTFPVIFKRTPYSQDEDLLILNYIIKNNRFHQGTTVSMWKNMAKNVSGLKHRTWLSLKERFRRTIIKNINFYNLSEDHIEKLLTYNKVPAYHNVKSKKKTGKYTKFITEGKRRERCEEGLNNNISVKDDHFSNEVNETQAVVLPRRGKRNRRTLYYYYSMFAQAPPSASVNRLRRMDGCPKKDLKRGNLKMNSNKKNLDKSLLVSSECLHSDEETAAIDSVSSSEHAHNDEKTVEQAAVSSTQNIHTGDEAVACSSKVQLSDEDVGIAISSDGSPVQECSGTTYCFSSERSKKSSSSLARLKRIESLRPRNYEVFKYKTMIRPNVRCRELTKFSK